MSDTDSDGKSSFDAVFDIEEQKPKIEPPSDLKASGTRIAVFLALYFVFNIGLTLFNKQVLGVVRGPPPQNSVHY